MNRQIRTRYAPSPTGYMHIGNLRTALYEYLIARKAGGTFILRIEDTDQDRLVEGSLDVIYRTLELVGMKYDEGPYFQSERLDIYRPYAEQLVEEGKAYRCFCSKERLESLRNKEEEEGQHAGYDGLCRNLKASDIQGLLDAGIPYVIRQKMPETGTTSFMDVVYGEITVENMELEDQILLKTDGYPTYNFANVIDDHLMEITHVVRGNEYLSSTPKYNLLYDAFGWEIPIYVHLPLIQNENKQKLSKRLGDKSFEDLLEEGYLVEAVVNYIALLGWSPGGERELFTLKELEEAFDVSGIGRSPSVFDRQKLKWMNGEYIKALSPEKFASMSKEAIVSGAGDSYDAGKIADILQQRVELMTEIPGMVGFFKGVGPYELVLYEHKKMKTDAEIALSGLELSFESLKGLYRWDQTNLHDLLMGLAVEKGMKNGQLLWPLRVALTGLASSPGGAIDIMDILGKEESLSRIRDGIEKLRMEGAGS